MAGNRPGPLALNSAAGFPVKDFLTGFKYPLAGFNLLLKPGIRRYVIIPLLVNILLFSLVIFYGAHEVIHLSDWLTSTWHWAEWLIWLIWPLFVILSVTVIFYCFTLIANLIAAPFNGFLAEAVEFHLTGTRPGAATGTSSLIGEIFRSLKSEFHKFIYFVVRALPLLILFIIPMVNTVAPFVWMLFCSWLMALEYLDFPMSNQGMHFPDIREKLKMRRQLCIGFGLGTLLLTMIPVLNFVAVPVAVTSATKLWVNELMRDNTVRQ